MPVHTAIVMVISPWVIQMIDKRQSAFLWKGITSVSGGHCKVAWPSVCKPPELGGLGLSNLELMGYALRLRWMCHRKTGTNKHWIALPEKLEQQLSDIFHYSTTVNVGDGTSMLFWADRWLDGRSIAELAPCIIRTIGPRIQRRRFVRDTPDNRRWVQDIKGALTVQVLLEYLSIWARLEGVTLTDAPDQVNGRWTKDGGFSTASAYRAFFSGQHAIPGAKLLHKTEGTRKMQVFLMAGVT
jgi:hypothetical protein